MSKFSIVMPVLLKDDDHRQVVFDTLESIKKNSTDFEMIIVDDGSPLLTGFLRDYADTYIRHKESKGIAPSWNDGIAVSRGEYVVIVNDDILVPKPIAGFDTWLNFFAAPFEKQNTDCGVTMPRRAGPTVEPVLEEGGDWLITEKWPAGFCFMLKRTIFLEKFDESFVPYNGEDVDYFWRILQKKKKIYRVPLDIWHKEGDVTHRLGNYEENSQKAVERFKTKHKVDPIQKFYS